MRGKAKLLSGRRTKKSVMLREVVIKGGEAVGAFNAGVKVRRKWDQDQSAGSLVKWPGFAGFSFFIFKARKLDKMTVSYLLCIVTT